MIDLKSEYSDTYRISLDESATIDRERSSRPWYYRIPCRYGHVSLHSADTLAAYCDRPRVFARLLEIPGVAIHQRGDAEISVTFPPSSLKAVADLLHARIRRHLSPERRAAASERLRRLADERRQVLPTPERA